MKNFFAIILSILIVYMFGYRVGCKEFFYNKHTPQLITKTYDCDSATRYDYQRQRCLINIMVSESYKETAYKCAAGKSTIGFGHRITKHDTFAKITFSQAYELLQSDFNGCIALSRELGYVNDNNCQLAVAHALYGLGYGAVSKIKDFKMKYCITVIIITRDT